MRPSKKRSRTKQGRPQSSHRHQASHRTKTSPNTKPSVQVRLNKKNTIPTTSLESAPLKCDRAVMSNKAQLTFKKVNGWGGKRRGAGRKNKTQTVNHNARLKLTDKTPLHITMKLKRGLNGLRTVKMLNQLKISLGKAKMKGLRTIHFSLQSNHLHLFAESDDNHSLARGMNSLGARFGREIRKKLMGKGEVFNGRYHVHVLKTPRETRHALAYVLLNTSKHQKAEPAHDDYSSSRCFREWAIIVQEWKRLAKNGSRPRPDFLSEANSWLAKAGWRR